MKHEQKRTGHQRSNGAREQQQDTVSEHTPTLEAHFTRTASHARLPTHDTGTEHGTRFLGLSISFSQRPIQPLPKESCDAGES